ncbi:MAG: Oligoendopeptidase, M3 family [uncultured bacterium]|nr:MAG: Oligoendopeptidase, M3 family [uncultured bacterium]
MRKFYPEEFKIENWENLEKELKVLLDFEVTSTESLIEFWEKVSELQKILEDKGAWLYINMTRYADKVEHKDAFNDFMAQIVAKSESYFFQLKKKFYDSNFRKDLTQKFQHLSKIIANEIEMFREENIALAVKEQEISATYGELVSKMTADWNGEEKTIQQLSFFLNDKDPSIREKAWRLTYKRYSKDYEKINDIFDELKELRIKMAKNAGFDNYRDYMHKLKGRFSYSPEDLLKLHSAVEKTVVPYLEELNNERKQKLGADVLRPWDFNVETEEMNPSPFKDYKELIEKGIDTITKVDPIFGREIKSMESNGFLDAENRKGKAPGGYCYPLYESGSSFIFMHAVGIRRDVETFVHEAGHAMHNMMSKGESIIQYTNNPSEVAELASMSMELLSLPHLDNFYSLEDLEKLKKAELTDKIRFLPWGTVVDAFQHWIYINPNHTRKEREEYFSFLLDRFKIGGDWTGLEKEKAMRWVLQLHIFSYPFYYIEYVIAQLGALAIFKNYSLDKTKTLEQYKEFLKLGYSKPVSGIYSAAGIPFDFSIEHIRQLIDFVRSELK